MTIINAATTPVATTPVATTPMVPPLVRAASIALLRSTASNRADFIGQFIAPDCSVNSTSMYATAVAATGLVGMDAQSINLALTVSRIPAHTLSTVWNGIKTKDIDSFVKALTGLAVHVIACEKAGLSLPDLCKIEEMDAKVATYAVA